jgi:hypothetical protein
LPYKNFSALVQLSVDKRMKWTSLFYIILICSISGELSFVFDETLQQFREDILVFQRDSMTRLDDSFFKFYTSVNSEINVTILQPYIQLREEFNKSCSSFPMFNLEVYAARRFINICDDIQRTIKLVFKYSHKIIEKYYPDPESLTVETLVELLAKEYFAGANEYLELIVPIYNQNPTCTKPLLNEFLSIYKKPINAMLVMNKNMIKTFQKSARRDFKFITSATQKLFEVKNKMTNCSDQLVIDTFGCVRGFVGFDCKKKKSGCGVVYKSIYLTLVHLKRIGESYKYYEQAFDRVYESFEESEESLIKWSDCVDKCIVI